MTSAFLKQGLKHLERPGRDMRGEEETDEGSRGSVKMDGWRAKAVDWGLGNQRSPGRDCCCCSVNFPLIVLEELIVELSESSPCQ